MTARWSSGRASSPPAAQFLQARPSVDALSLWRVAPRAGVGDVVAAELAGARGKRLGAQEAEKGLQRRAEIVALAHRDVEAFPHDRHEAEAGRLGDRAGRDAAIGAARADRL